MRRWRRKALKLAAAGLLVMLAAAAVAYFVVLPRIVHQRVAELFDNAGIEGARFIVWRVTPWGAVLGNLELGPQGQVKIEQVIVSYSAREVIYGRVDSVR